MISVKIKASKCGKIAKFALLESTKLISRKIQASKCDKMSEFAPGIIHFGNLDNTKILNDGSTKKSS